MLPTGVSALNLAPVTDAPYESEFLLSIVLLASVRGFTRHLPAENKSLLTGKRSSLHLQSMQKSNRLFQRWATTISRPATLLVHSGTPSEFLFSKPLTQYTLSPAPMSSRGPGHSASSKSQGQLLCVLLKIDARACSVCKIFNSPLSAYQLPCE
jgi:hypothetical protein